MLYFAVNISCSDSCFIYCESYLTQFQLQRNEIGGDETFCAASSNFSACHLVSATVLLKFIILLTVIPTQHSPLAFHCTTFNQHDGSTHARSV